MLSYPKLCEQYFSLLASLLLNRPRAAITLPPQLHAPTLASLEFGLSHHATHICRAALEAVYDLGRHASQARNRRVAAA